MHYRINPSLPPGVPFSSSQFLTVVQTLAQTWMKAVPSVELVYDGTTGAQPVGFNNVVGFIPVATGYANITQNVTSDGRTYTGFNIQLSSNASWDYQFCDGSSVPCTPYAGTGVDLAAILAHCWGHALGLSDVGALQDRLLSDYGAISNGSDCSDGGGGPVCRFAVTLGLGDVLGVRHLYPTSAPMPSFVYDQ